MLSFSAPFHPVFLYAETHFRFFPAFPSLIFKKEPEIVFDLPYRCDPGNDLPVVLIVNDIHRFNATVADVAVTVSQEGMAPLAFKFNDPTSRVIDHPFREQARVFVFRISRRALPSGRIFVNCMATLQNEKRRWVVLNDNFFSTSKLPFSCYLSDEQLPGHDTCAFGDLHVHSQYSQSQVEFGPPINIIDLISNTCGLDFVGITDHSYDLACSMADYLQKDNTLARWNSLVGATSPPGTFKNIILLGEEISTLNVRGKAIHLCGLGLNKFITGSVDGARSKKFKTMRLDEAIKEVHRQGGLAMAAHPGSRFGLLQRILLRRGSWTQKEMAVNLDAVQAVNDGFGTTWLAGKQLWINELLRGRRLPVIAGNDSHGDFNRYRYLSTPFFSISENFNRHLSFARTGIYCKARSGGDVLSAIQRGATFVTSGPYLAIIQSSSLGEDAGSAQLTAPAKGSITATIKSSYEFGTPKRLDIFLGQVGEKKERIVFSRGYSGHNMIIQEISLGLYSKDAYARAEVSCARQDGTKTFAATSPLYFTTG
jgi:hypothetical protein